MKKLISILLCISMMAVISLNAAAENNQEVILSAADAQWELPAGFKTEAQAGAWKHEDTDTVMAVRINSSTHEEISVTYNDIPSGLYEVFYFIPGYWDQNDTMIDSRSSIILDIDLKIRDKNDEYAVESLKNNDMCAKGYVNVGVYEFTGKDDYIKATINEENHAADGSNFGYTLFSSSKIKLVPVINTHTELLNAVNSSKNADDIKNAAESYGVDFLDLTALSNMNAAYSKVYEKKKGDYPNAFVFKRELEEAVKDCLKKVIYNSYSSAFKVNAQDIPRTNRESLSLNACATIPDGLIFYSFKGLKTDAKIQKAELKLTSSRLRTNAVLEGVCGDIYAETNLQTDSKFDEMNFSVLEDKQTLMNTYRDVTSEILKNSAQENGYLHFKLSGQQLPSSDPNSNISFYSPEAELVVWYDETAVNKAEFEVYLEDGRRINSAEEFKINDKDYKKLFLKSISEIADDSFLNSLTVLKNDIPIKVSAELSDSNTILVVFDDKLEYSSEYIISCEDYLSLKNDDMKYIVNYSFYTEKYPLEFSGIKLMNGSEKVDDIDIMLGKTLTMSADIKNNSLGKTDIVLMINLFEKTSDGVKMLDSKICGGILDTGETLEMSNEKLFIPEKQSDYFVTANIWSDLKKMNTVKIYNTQAMRID